MSICSIAMKLKRGIGLVCLINAFLLLQHNEVAIVFVLCSLIKGLIIQMDRREIHQHDPFHGSEKLL